MDEFTNGSPAQTSAPVSTSAPLQTIGVKDFMIAQGFVSIVKTVRANANQYPYVTFINAKNVAENIYFSKRASVAVTEGEEIGKGWLDKFQIAITTNAVGEPRTKLVSKGEGLRTELNDLF